ncbi:sensor domain-containing diguanylate cyclase [Massilia atriviolacea]|uniref:diguanylate cyclase n=2 Tax=Massilia atriviolacea TaxID=2495579 RepID=A0A430HPQ7_9BURK|nr:sensor domain-containing diguanylate cyclase [Massilia atriviolacea]
MFLCNLYAKVGGSPVPAATIMLDTLPCTLSLRLLDNALDAIVVIDEDGAIRYQNGAMQALSGYACGEALGQPLAGLLPAAMAEQHHRYVRAYLDSCKESTVLGQVREFAIRHRTGEMVPIGMKAIDLGIHEGKRYFGAFLEDLRARRRMQAEREALLAQLEKQALSDALTGLPNRRAFDAEAALTCARAARSGALTCVGIADIDFFKKVNDRYGHAAGDAVLASVAGLIGQASRATDFVARTGGEEFSLLFPGIGSDIALVVAERIRAAVEREPIVTPDGQQVSVTISIGLAQLAPGAPFAEALARADAALYEAKNGGRNLVCAR